MATTDDNRTPPEPLSTPDAGTREYGLKRLVFFGSATLIVALSVWAILTPSGASNAIGSAVSWISSSFGWYYFLAATLYLGFVLFVGFSRYGRVKLGPQHSTPDYGVFSWAAMLFAAGIGIDLMFFSVSGPVSHYLAPPEGQGQTAEAARQAVVWTLFHYGITGWAMYALMGMVLGYFAFRYRLPLAIRSALYPIIGKRIHGRFGDTVDLAAIMGTIFGISVSLGIGVVQLNYGLRFMFGIPEGTAAQIGLVVVAVLMATVSAVSGVDKGIRRLSQLNIILAALLMVYVLVLEGPARLLNALILNIGDYVSRFPSMTLNTFAYDQPVEWLNDWTLFFWAWWVAWAPFVGLFLARISRGRTLRQFVAATLVVPFLFTLTFLSILGNSALGVVRRGNLEFGETAMNTPEQGFYGLLAQYPGVTFSAGLATFVGLLLYVTSADSGALVMANLSTRLPTPVTDAKPWLRIFWALATGLLTMAMLVVGGVDALTSATIIMGLPFSLVMFLIIWGLYRALRVERFREEALRTTLPSSLSVRTTVSPGQPLSTWRHRLARALSYPGPRAARRFVNEVCRPALHDVAEELRTRGLDANVHEETEPGGTVPYLALRVSLDAEPDFGYWVRPVERPTPSYAMRSVAGHDTYYRMEVHLSEGGQGYDVMGYTRDQLIGDVLDQYERHLEFLRLSGETESHHVLPDHAPAPSDESPPEDEER
ncbi:choline BCCT transporter BetT [Saccharomonospora glauca]|uniref:Choline/carnitine/betaine transport n=1 Tax=Saccharomonospora glauca K62 TaxID=928724 RepID=I1D3K4_9PSEU|nr:choline/carnitine/betaine transport [Saccharomonospora glauca K62]